MGILTDYDSAVPLLEAWLRTQLHLPQSVDKLLLKRFIHASKGDLERTKKLIETNYMMRNNYSQIFLKRDPCDDMANIILETTDMLVLPSLTPEGNKILFYRLCNLDADKFHFTEAIKMFFMMADVRFITPEPDGTVEGEIPIFDMTGFSLRHITKVAISSLRIYMKFTQEAHPVRLKEIHVINCPPFLDKVLTIVKPFMKSEVFKLIKFHLPGSDTLYESISKDMLPNEFGGKAGCIKDIKDKWITILRQKRDYLMDEKNWKINEANRTKNSSSKDINRNFKTLNID